MNKIQIPLLALMTLFFVSCSDTQKTEKPSVVYQNKGQEIVHKMIKKVGSLEQLKNKKDVTYTYTYKTPNNGSDVSVEKYIFDGEKSYGKYSTHDRTLPQLNGTIEQGFDGTTFWLKHNNTYIDSVDMLKRVTFNRKTNYYWFTMFQKLMDPGLVYSYQGDTTINSNDYDVVSVGFTNETDTPTDTYQLYINKTTQLVDQFLFTVVDFGLVDTPMLMQVEYTTVDGMMIPSKRKYKKSTWSASVDDKPWTEVQWSNITFNTNVTKDIFVKK